ncbi:YitT family protein [Paenibacillus sp. IHBB 10380]|uniref:YitT family protein n=1 Tax=Paenibacillus sp. IHBB 10380 TaxID=1566358 RepID=UPI0005CFADF6|nr:YitT family protein [Paenibacillus sp. IHBB 10380]AJS57897.1 membrane protein [Paenibacillus sp. IHBB 10380]
MRKKEQLISTIQQIAVMLLGTCLLSFTYYHINFQNHLSEGGFVGLALLGKYVLDLPPALSMIILDIPVLLVALFIKGRKFLMNTIIATVSFSIFYEGMERYSTLVIDMQQNLFLAALLSGVMTGFATGLVVRFGGATGGDDILSLLISRWTGMKLGSVFFLLDAIVLLLSIFYLPLRETLYTILAVSVAGKVITLTVTYQRRRTPRKVRVATSVSVPNKTVTSKPIHAIHNGN